MDEKTASNGSETPLALMEYLFLRLKEVGISSIHGVPGDFNLTALDYISTCGLQWVGNCNELNAGFAADGYARVHGIAALMTVMGVGELSAMNALAGSFTEYVPIVHIVGWPSRKQAQQRRLYLHHSLDNGDAEAFRTMSARVSSTTIQLECAEDAPELIDHAIRECKIQSRPVTILVPCDIVGVPIKAANLEKVLDLSIQENDATQERQVVDAIIQKLDTARRPVLLIGGYGIRHRVLKEVLRLVQSAEFPIFTTPSGRGIIDENHARFSGTYVGQCSNSSTLHSIVKSDLILSIGNIPSDLSAAGYTGHFDQNNIVDLRDRQIHIGQARYSGLCMKGVLQALIEPMKRYRKSTRAARPPPLNKASRNGSAGGQTSYSAYPSESETSGVSKSNRKCCPSIRSLGISLSKSKPIIHDWFWPTLGQWLQRDDIVITETGTSSFGIWMTPFPKGINFLSQYLWASIGYSLAACQGAALAVRDSAHPGRRTILLVGDGSFQFTCQELSTIIRLGIHPIIFLICNNGYTVERLIHGWRADYNDIQPWKYRRLPSVFGAHPRTYRTYCVRSRRQLLALFEKKSFREPFTLQIVELHVAQEDAPSNLVHLANCLKKRN